MINQTEINLNAIAHNVSELRRITCSDAILMAVVKANAYGHGAVQVARQALRYGAECLGVARLDEGIRLRQAGIDAPILILGYTPPDHIRQLIEYDLIQTTYSLETARSFSERASSLGKTINVHLKIDTGMGRLGFSAPWEITLETNRIVHEIEILARLPGLEISGIFTHFSNADSADKSFAIRQFEIFTNILNQLRLNGLEFPIRHAANSAAIIDMPETHLDMVRAGISLYGLYPSDDVCKTRISLKPAMTFKSKIIHLKHVPAGFPVSYGITYETPSPTTIATIPVGYADGLNRLLSSRGHMLVRGCKAPITGRVCMDLTMLDVGHIPDVRMEDEVLVFGRQGNAEITVDEVASMLNTINYEVVSTIAERVPRVWVE